MRPDRKLITDMFVRVCRDSGHSLDAVRAMTLTANILHIHPLEVGYAMPSLQAAQDIAAGRLALSKEGETS
jgi:hypothetical protein